MAKLEQLKTMDDREIQKWLRIIDVIDLKYAMLGIDKETKNCIYRNLSLLAEKVLEEFIENNFSNIESNIIMSSINRLELELENSG